MGGVRDLPIIAARSMAGGANFLRPMVSNGNNADCPCGRGARMTADLPDETTRRWPVLVAPVVLPLYGVATWWLLSRGGVVTPWAALERVAWTFVLAASTTAMSLLGTWYSVHGETGSPRCGLFLQAPCSWE